MSDPPTTASETAGSPASAPELNRTRAFLAVLPFFALGLADVVLLLFWGLDPLWGFAIMPPIIFISVIGWIAFRSGFVGPGGESDDVL